MRRVALWCGAGCCGVAVAVMACAPSRAITRVPSDLGPLVLRLAKAGPFPRHWAARLSLPTRDAVCGAESARPLPLVCGAPALERPSTALVNAMADVNARLRADQSADAVHAAALIELLSVDAGKAVDRSISYLSAALRLAAPTSSRLSDLAAAYLARASITGSVEDALRALDASSRAVEMDSTNAAAWYNHTLAMSALSLDGTASRARRRYERFDASSAFARDLRRTASALADSPTPTFTDADFAAVPARVRRAPVAAMSVMWEGTLGRWGTAVLSGDREVAATALDRARVVAQELAALGDSTTFDAVRAIEQAARTSHTSDVLHILASAHASLAEAQALRRDGRLERADTAFDALVRAPVASPALRARITADAANHDFTRGRSMVSERRLAIGLRTVGIARFPAVAARMHWIRGVSAFRRGAYSAALRDLRSSRTLFASIAFSESAAWVQGIEGELQMQIGNDRLGHELLVDALRRSRDVPASIGRHNSIFVLASSATVHDMPAAALALVEEDFAANREHATPITRSEIALSRVRHAVGTHRLPANATLIDAAARAIAAIPDTATRNTLRHELGILRGRAILSNDPAAARTVLDSAVAVLDSTNNPIKILPALLARSHAAIASGADAIAERDLLRAAAIYDQKSRQVLDVPGARSQVFALLTQREALRRQAKPVFDSLVLRRLRRADANRDGAALALLERGRLGLFADVASESAPTPHSPTQPSTVVYAVVGDAVLAWTNGSGAIRAHRLPIVRDSLVRLVERTRLILERNDDRAARALLARLYDVLIRPIAGHLGPDQSTLRIVPDAALANVPFAALRDAEHARFLVEAFATEIAHRWHVAPRKQSSAGIGRDERALLVSDPLYDATVWTHLPALTYAREEARALAPRFASTTELRGHAATVAAMTKALPNVAVFHYAGHAVLNDAQPERSALVVGEAGLSSATIAQLDLRRMRVAVLAACETSRLAPGADGGTGALASAFLAAGAERVVGTLWRVDDAATARFVDVFYSKLGDARRVAGAVRDAQLALKTRPVSEWSGFRAESR